jgi:hypothetical protein
MSLPRPKLKPLHQRKRNKKTPEQLADMREVKAQRSAALTEAFEAKKGGRPPGYLGEVHDRMAEDLRMAGCSVEQIATAMGMGSIQVLYRWLEEKPTFCEAWFRGGDYADAQVARKVFQRACGYKHEAVKILSVAGEVQVVPYVEHYPPDTAAAVFWLTNRKPKAWKQRNSTELTGPDGEPLTPPSIEVVAVAAPKRD